MSHQSSDTPETLSHRLFHAFFKFKRTPWHNAPADGLSQVETNILDNIRRANSHDRVLHVSDLSSMLRVTSPTITQHLNNLESRGFVERNTSKEDRRAITLTLTDKGQEALKTHRAKLEEDFSMFIASIGEEDAETMIRLLEAAQRFFIDRAKTYENEILIDRG